MKKFILALICLCLAFSTTGCVRRVVTIDSQPHGADIYFDRKLIGQTPHTHEFIYYGSHHLELVKEGYANVKTALKLKAPIYEYFPLCVFSELLWPGQITNQHQANFQLEPGESKKPIISTIQEPQPSLPPPRIEKIKIP